MDTFHISLGDRVELRPQLPDGSYSSRTYYSMVQNVKSDQEFQILPLTTHNLKNWIGHILQVTVIQNKKAYAGTVRIERITKEGKLRFFDLVVVDDLKEIQRRDYYRLQYNADLEIEGHGKFKTFDISGNGLAFISDEKFNKGETLAITLHLGDHKLDICGVVVRCADFLSENHLVSVYYKDIERKVQNQIIGFLHKQQLIMLRKGVLQN